MSRVIGLASVTCSTRVGPSVTTLTVSSPEPGHCICGWTACSGGMGLPGGRTDTGPSTACFPADGGDGESGREQSGSGTEDMGWCSKSVARGRGLISNFTPENAFSLRRNYIFHGFTMVKNIDDTEQGKLLIKPAEHFKA